MKKYTPFDITMNILAFLPFIVAILIYSTTPDTIPVHYGSDGIVDEFSNRQFIFFIPTLTLICLLPFNLANIYTPTNQKIFKITRLILTLIMTVICFVLLYLQYNNVQTVPTFRFSFADIIFMITGIIFIITGIMSPVTSYGYSLIKDEQIRNKTDKLTRIMSVLGGIVLVLAPIFSPRDTKMTVIITTIVLMCILPIMYPFFLTLKKNK